MIALLTGLAQAVAAVAVPDPSPSAFSVEPLWLAAGAIIGAVARSFWVKHQRPWSKETGFDCFCAGLVGLLWRVLIALTGGWVPDFRPEWDYLTRATIMAVVGFACAELVKRLLIEKAPQFLERRLGAVLPKNGEETK
jgi:hypothetical protein